MQRRTSLEVMGRWVVTAAMIGVALAPVMVFACPSGQIDLRDGSGCVPDLVAPGSVRANPFTSASGQVGGLQEKSGVGTASLEEIIGKIIQGAIALTGVLFFGYTVWAGYLWMTARGEEDKVTEAKNMIQNGIIGLGIVLAAYVITSFIVNRLVDTGALVQ